MKVVQQCNEKPKYVPITITLETAEEFMELYSIVNNNTQQTNVEKWVKEDFNIDNYVSPNSPDLLYESLKQLKQQVKETL